MLFNSIVFIFVFLPVLLLLYYLVVPKRFRNHLLLLSSLIFYAWGGVSYSIILLGSLLFNYIFVTQINKNKDNKKTWLWVGIVFNLLLIFVFKYLDFFIENINLLNAISFKIGPPLPLFNIVLPLGISFFTFQQMSMLWDVYRNNTERKRPKFLDTALYISFFPQLIAGPIVRYNNIINQIRHRKESLTLFRSGIQRFILGLFKKVIIANQMAIVADGIMTTSPAALNTSTAWMGLLSYSLQIYFDFSGYSDMAIGLGRMFGFKILENFNFPYISTSIKEFWRRWHISLSTWFRDYLYIPLGGNRKGIKRTYINLFIVFLLTGFWHGATWSFIFWGLFHGAFLIIERLGFDKILNRLPRMISWIYTMLVVMIAWVFFRIENINGAIDFLIRMFSFTENKPVSIYSYINVEYSIVLVIALLSGSTFWIRALKIVEKSKKNFANLYIVAGDMLSIAAFLLCILYINSASYSPFIYFRF